MEPKKNPKADIRRNSSLFFAVGLALMLLITNYAINYKTYDKEAIDIGQLSMDELDDEEKEISCNNKKKKVYSGFRITDMDTFTELKMMFVG